MEIYNETLTDLLDPSAGNLEIRQKVFFLCLFCFSFEMKHIMTLGLN